MSSAEKIQMGRREFLLASSVGTLGAMVVGPKLFALAEASPRSLAVGFASFDDGARIIAASDVPAGDGGFIRSGARVVATGVSGLPGQAHERRAVELVAHFPYVDGGVRREAPFRAWAGSRATGCQGNSLSFNVPVDDQQRIRFSVVVESGAVSTAPTTRRDIVGNSSPTRSQEMPVTLSLLDEAGSLKLRRGYYVIVPLFENDAQPRWSSWQVRRHDGRMALVDREGAAASFEHLVLGIDYATISA